MAAGVMSSEEVPSFPQTALLKLQQFLSIFPPPADASLSTPSQVLNVLLTIHPALGYLSAAGWRSFENALESSGLEEWTSGIAECDSADVALQGVGIWGWDLKAISRVDDKTAKLTFVRGGVEEVVVNVPAGPLPFTPYPLTAEAYPDIYQTPRFAHLLTSLFQLHALGLFDISFLPPSSSLQTSSASSTLVINTFAGLLGYELCTIHLFREIGGREIWMRRVVNSGADGHGSITGWEPSLLTKAALEGQLVHLEGIDTIGATAGSLGRLLMDRENELWEGKRLVGPLKEGEVSGYLFRAQGRSGAHAGDLPGNCRNPVSRVPVFPHYRHFVEGIASKGMAHRRARLQLHLLAINRDGSRRRETYFTRHRLPQAPRGQARDLCTCLQTSQLGPWQQEQTSRYS